MLRIKRANALCELDLKGDILLDFVGLKSMVDRREKSRDFSSLICLMSASGFLCL